MQIWDALSIEGTEYFGVLCYGVFPHSELDAVVERMCSIVRDEDSRIYKLSSDEWPFGLVLHESKIKSQNDVAGQILKSFTIMFSFQKCQCCISMYDGAFLCYDDLFSVDVCAQIYAFSFNRDGYVVALDSEVLLSSEWRSVIGDARRRFLNFHEGYSVSN